MVLMTGLRLVIASRRRKVCECVASVAVRSDRRKETIHSVGDHREVAMHHATNTLSTHAQWCAANAHRCCVCGVDASPLRSLKYIFSALYRPGNLAAPLIFNHLDARGTITIMDSYAEVFDAIDNDRRRVDRFYSFWYRR